MHQTIFNSDLKCQFSVHNKKINDACTCYFQSVFPTPLVNYFVPFEYQTHTKESLIQPSPPDTTLLPMTVTVIPCTNLLRWITRRILPSTCVENFSAGAWIIPHHLMGYLLLRPGLCICFTTLILLYLRHQLHNNFLFFQRMSRFTTISRDFPIVQIPSWCVFNSFTARAYFCFYALAKARNNFFKKSQHFVEHQ